MFKRRDNGNSGGRFDTLIGKNASVQGDIDFSGGLHVDGRVTGSVRGVAGAAAAALLSVSEHAVIEGSVAAAQVVLNGCINGDIWASERVTLGSKARVQGNVHYGVIEMALGAEISGKLVPHKAQAGNRGDSGQPGEASGPADRHGGAGDAPESAADGRFDAPAGAAYT